MYIKLFCLFFLFQYVAPNATTILQLSSMDIRTFVVNHNRRLPLAKREVHHVTNKEINYSDMPPTQKQPAEISIDNKFGLEKKAAKESWFNRSRGGEYTQFPTEN